MRPRKTMMAVLTILFCMSLLLLTFSCDNNDDDEENDPTTPITATPTPTATPGTETYNIVGAWTYTMKQGSDTWDSGAMEFTGTAASGSFTQKTVHNAEYTGTYTVSGNAVSLKGTEDWTGAFANATTMSGTWASNDTADTGTWTMTKTQ